MVVQPAKSNGTTWHALSHGGTENVSHAANESAGLRARVSTRRRLNVGLQMNFLASVVLVMMTETDWSLRLKDIGWFGRTSSTPVALLKAAGGNPCTATATALVTTSCNSTRTDRQTLGSVMEH